MSSWGVRYDEKVLGGRPAHLLKDLKVVAPSPGYLQLGGQAPAPAPAVKGRKRGRAVQRADEGRVQVVDSDWFYYYYYFLRCKFTTAHTNTYS